jgi:hypothetical protein
MYNDCRIVFFLNTNYITVGRYHQRDRLHPVLLSQHNRNSLINAECFSHSNFSMTAISPASVV